MLHGVQNTLIVLLLVTSPLSLMLHLLLNDVGLLHSLLQELGNRRADGLDLLDEVLGVSGQEFSGRLELLIHLLGLDVSFGIESTRGREKLTICSASTCFSSAFDLTHDSIVSAGRPAFLAASLSWLTSSSTSPGAAGRKLVRELIRLTYQT